MERWLPVSGHDDFYEVSSLGKVRSFSRITSNNKPIPSTTLKPCLDKNGYERVVLCVDNIRAYGIVHRLVAVAFLEHDPVRSFVNHKDGNPRNNCVDNLEWVTGSENVQHALNVLGRKFGKRGASLVAYNDDETISFETLSDAKKAGFSKSAIYACIWGGRPRHKGFKWKRAA